MLEYHSYGGPGTSYQGGKLPPRVKDIICHYFYLLGVNPNTHAQDVPPEYQPHDLHLLGHVLPPPDFTMPAWAVPGWGKDNHLEDVEDDTDNDLENVKFEVLGKVISGKQQCRKRTIPCRGGSEINLPLLDSSSLQNLSAPLPSEESLCNPTPLTLNQNILHSPLSSSQKVFLPESNHSVSPETVIENIDNDDMEVVEIKQEQIAAAVEDFTVVSTENIQENQTKQAVSVSDEDDSPMSITIHSKGHDPIQITLNKSKPVKRTRLC